VDAPRLERLDVEARDEPRLRAWEHALDHDRLRGANVTSRRCTEATIFASFRRFAPRSRLVRTSTAPRSRLDRASFAPRSHVDRASIARHVDRTSFAHLVRAPRSHADRTADVASFHDLPVDGTAARFARRMRA
jgi:hypothetical protein